MDISVRVDGIPADPVSYRSFGAVHAMRKIHDNRCFRVDQRGLIPEGTLCSTKTEISFLLISRNPIRVATAFWRVDGVESPRAMGQDGDIALPHTFEINRFGSNLDPKW